MQLEIVLRATDNLNASQSQSEAIQNYPKLSKATEDYPRLPSTAKIKGTINYKTRKNQQPATQLHS